MGIKAGKLGKGAGKAAGKAPKIPDVPRLPGPDNPAVNIPGNKANLDASGTPVGDTVELPFDDLDAGTPTPEVMRNDGVALDESAPPVVEVVPPAPSAPEVIDAEFTVRPPESKIPSVEGAARGDVPDRVPRNVKTEGKQPLSVPERAPDDVIPGRRGDIDQPNAQKVKEPWSWKKRLGVYGGGLAGILTILQLLKEAGRPPAQPLPPGFDPLGPGGQGGGQGGVQGGGMNGGLGAGGMTPADRIRAMQGGGGFKMRINPNTQYLDSWTN